MMIQELIKMHEEYKAKWLRLTADDLFNRNNILEQMLDLRTTKRSELLESKNELENKKAIRKLELKDEKWEDWKKKHTVDSADAVIMQEFRDEDIQQIKDKAMIDMIENKIAVIPDYINLWKRFLPT